MTGIQIGEILQNILTAEQWKELKIDNAVRCVIASLRKKLEQYTDKDYIQTVRGIGYKFEIPEA